MIDTTYAHLQREQMKRFAFYQAQEARSSSKERRGERGQSAITKSTWEPRSIFLWMKIENELQTIDNKEQ